MKIETLRLKLREPFVTGTRTYHAREVVRVFLDDMAGEAAPLPGFSLESASEVAALLRQRRRDLARLCESGSAMSELLDEIGERFALPSARFAVETLALNIRARREHCTVPGLFGDASRDAVEVNVTIPALPPGQAALRAEALRARGYRVFKVKLGADLERNRQLLAAVRGVLGRAARLRGDANGCWDTETARRQLDELAQFGPDYVEQPLPPGSERELSLLRDVPVPIALDESLRDESVVTRALEEDLADYFILKPTVLGGFARTREMAERIRAHGKRFVLTTALAGAVERRACFDLACLLPEPLPACGLNTAGFVDGDPESDGLCVSEGRMIPREIEAHERAAL